MNRILELDRSAFVYLNGLFGVQYDVFWLLVTELRNWLPLYFICVTCYFVKFPKRQALIFVLLLALTSSTIAFLTAFVKEFFKRIRPNNNPYFEDTINVLLDPSSYSFFSGHASFSFAFASFVVATLHKEYKILLLLYGWAFFVAFSRLQVGVHYPLDILAGTIIGLFVGLLYARFSSFLIGKIF